LNGAASVVGSILAMILSMNYGFSISLITGIVIYLIGMLAFPSEATEPTARALRTNQYA
jgi:predicted membrane channel-forming protein YqfA (hemolysin III family)